MLFVEVVADDVLRHLGDLRTAQVLADSDEFHLRRDDAGAGVGKLGGGLSALRAQDLPRGQCGGVEVEGCFVLAFGLRQIAVLVGQIAVINRLDWPTVGFLHIAAAQNPVTAQCRQALLHRAVEVRITPWTGAVINAHR